MNQVKYFWHTKHFADDVDDETARVSAVRSSFSHEFLATRSKSRFAHALPHLFPSMKKKLVKKESKEANEDDHRISWFM